ncbi:cysteine desulfurase [Geitlerinema sp. P-1104]|uniref:cysteine desulfurase family protein n=1 Tax=Geitlerinema sp. P-1104 TaxID=2546230 RepID=UPI0014769023|nr:cysteine desulfurase family protein [Geitlerinema sp. P-1104]NMG58791.1 cysteine desulfurase [Geitlerinema sp. P-1104]
MQIYLDHSATTPTRSEAVEAMLQSLTQAWGNPSSLHHWGEAAATAVEMARLQVADLINAPAESIIFTSGGTEANNLALMGVLQGRLRFLQASRTQPGHLIISTVEHAAISEPARQLEEQGWQVTRLPVSPQGRVNPEILLAALRPDTALVSVIYGQSEVGTVQPIAELAAIARQHGVLFHTDAVQVAGRLPLNVEELGVDLLSLSSHKLYGPKGVGALYVRPGLSLQPLLAGGGQERGRRSGTEAVPNMVGFGVAAALAAEELEAEAQRLQGLRDRLFEQLAGVWSLQVTGDRQHRLPHHVSFLVDAEDSQGKPITGKALVRQLNLAGIAISSGSACHSGKLAPSPVLLAMGYPERLARAGIRLTLGRDTRSADIDWTAQVLKPLVTGQRPL